MKQPSVRSITTVTQAGNSEKTGKDACLTLAVLKAVSILLGAGLHLGGLTPKGDLIKLKMCYLQRQEVREKRGEPPANEVIKAAKGVTRRKVSICWPGNAAGLVLQRTSRGKSQLCASPLSPEI